MKKTVENKIEKLQKLLEDKRQIEEQIEQLLDVNKKNPKRRAQDADNESIHYLDEVMTVFQERPNKIMRAKQVVAIIEKNKDITVDDGTVKSTMVYAGGKKGLLERVSRGRYRLKHKESE